ncbi:hypothetical protein [Nocardia sp. N2S4-5]|uniref:hypothetical protein n=1 Tax=Nocardia sp. N2S4-5 TaxID=3351565 RepID=UPI0037D334D4
MIGFCFMSVSCRRRGAVDVPGSGGCGSIGYWCRLERMVTDPIELELRRGELLAQLSEMRRAVAELSDGYAALPESGLVIDTVGAGALTTPGYCIAGAREVLAEALIELDAAGDAMERAGQYTGRLRGVVFD